MSESENLDIADDLLSFLVKPTKLDSNNNSTDTKQLRKNLQQLIDNLSKFLKSHSSVGENNNNSYNIRSIMVGVTGSVLSYMVITYGLIPALNWYKNLSIKFPKKGVTIRNIEELLKLKKHYPETTGHTPINLNLPSLSSDMSIIVRIINDKGFPQPIMDSYEEESGNIPTRLQNVWEIISSTVANDVAELQPTLIPNAKGTLSFVTIPVPQSKDLISELQNKLKVNHFIPISTPQRGPLAHKSFLTFDTSLVKDRIHPELLITVIF
jgi:hypothetical protein